MRADGGSWCTLAAAVDDALLPRRFSLVCGGVSSAAAAGQAVGHWLVEEAAGQSNRLASCHSSEDWFGWRVWSRRGSTVQEEECGKLAAPRMMRLGEEHGDRSRSSKSRSGRAKSADSANRK